MPYPVEMERRIPIATANSASPLHIVQVGADFVEQVLFQRTFRAAEPNVNLRQFAASLPALAYVTAYTDTIDLFMIDLGLAGNVSGLELTCRIRDLGCTGHIILSSTYGSPERALLNRLRAEFLPKPQHILDVASTLSKYRGTAP